MLPETHEIYRGLQYPFGREIDPPPGEPQAIADGVYWVRFPMPMSLDHINLWLLEDGPGWTIVDTCLALPRAKALWEQLFEGFMAGRPVTRVICTHMHPDHVGLAGWICERFDCALWMSLAEYLTCRTLVADTGREAPQVALDFYRRAGYTEAQLENYRQRFGFFGKAVSPLPDSYRRLLDMETLSIGGRYWQVVMGSGHSPEHACLYCPSLKLLIAGDQVLPRITPNVSVFPTEPEGDPLKAWLYSSGRLRERLPEDLLVLPSHEAPFLGLHTRLSQIIDGHQRDLEKLITHLAEPRRAVDCFAALFNREIGDRDLGLATGETLAHLNCLLGQRRIRRSLDDDDVYRYLQDPDSAGIDDD
jgi:glyoxylase-like metal-dependent hydrolase (beta-lactamase superfamily II)